MVLLTLLGLVLVIVGYLSYKFYLAPKRERERYIRLFQSLGYKVHAYPFLFASNSAIRAEQQSLSTKGDAFYALKFERTNADVIIFNVLNRIVIYLVNPKLIRQALQPEKVDVYPKISTTFRGVTSLIGEGLVFS